MLLAAGFFVANVLLIRALGQAGVDVWMIAALRFAAGLALCVGARRSDLDVEALFLRPRLILRGIVGGVSTYGFYLTVVELGAGRATFLNNTYVVFSALLAVWVLAEPFGRALALGAAAALGGLGLLTGAVFGLTQVGFYDAVALVVALAGAWVVVMIRQLHREGISTTTIFASQCVYGLLVAAPFVLLRAQWPDAALAGGLLLAGIFAGAGQLLMTHAYRDLPVAEGALIQTLVPLGIAAGGFVFFGELFGPAEILGGLLIVSGSLLPMLPGLAAKPRPAGP